MDRTLDTLLQHPGLWRPGERPVHPLRSLPTRVPALDAALPGGGLPVGAVTEVLNTGIGVGELSLLLPALAGLSCSGSQVVWVAPPHLPYPPALQQAGVALERLLCLQPASPDESLWAAEQCLRSGVCGAVLVWLDDIDTTAIRRLQLAAESGDSCCLLLRDAHRAANASPAALRLWVGSDGMRRQLRVLKCRGGQPQDVALAA